MSNLIDWAKWWVAAGCAVFPLPPNMKKPNEHGLGILSATTNIANVENWWNANPECNIGVVGDPHATSRFILRVDVDPKRDGHLRWNELLKQYGDAPTLTVSTPSGGHHYYFVTPEAFGNGTGSLPVGIDIRGHNSGYTVGAGSVTIDLPPNQVAGAYTLVNNQVMADAPEWLINIIQRPKTGEAPRDTTLRTEVTPEQIAELRSALLSPGMLKDWRRWSDNGLALRSLGSAGYELWCEYSNAQLMACPNEVPGDDTAETWWARHRPESVKSDYRSIFTRAQALGWKNPKAVDTTTLGFGMVQPPQTVTAPTGRKFTLLSEDEFSSGPARQWRIDNILPEQGLAMIYGDSGIGKSFLNLDMLGCISDGRPYGADQRKVKQGRVVYVLGEGAGGMRQRLRAYRHKNPATHQNFKIINVAPNLMNPQDVADIMQTIMEAGGADVIVFDTLHACMVGGDENSAKDMGILLSNARAIQACINGLVMFVHHSGKDESKGARGSSSIRGAMETQIELTMSQHIAGRRVARLAKQRDGDDSLLWEFDLEQVIIFGDNPLTSAVVKHIASEAQEMQRATNTVKDGNRRKSKNQTLICDIVKAKAADYPTGIPLDILIAEGNRARQDLKPPQIRLVVSKCIEEGLLAIDNDSMIRLAWR